MMVRVSEELERNLQGGVAKKNPVQNNELTGHCGQRRSTMLLLACPEAPGSDGKEGRGARREEGWKEGPPFQIGKFCEVE
jgi:hypothetical protein